MRKLGKVIFNTIVFGFFAFIGLIIFLLTYSRDLVKNDCFDECDEDFDNDFYDELKEEFDDDDFT